MPKNEKDIQILSSIARNIAEKQSKTDNEDAYSLPNTETNISPNKTFPLALLDLYEKKELKGNIKKKTPTLKDIAIKKQTQNLAERKVLLIILAILLGIQLFFMNAVVLLIILWSLFDWDCFRELNPDVLCSIFDFTKYYVTAVLVELLGGIIYIVHRVFSTKE